VQMEESSSIIDPRGRMVKRTNMYTETALVGTIQSRVEKTFYSTHGDLIARILAVLTAAIVLVAIGRGMYGRMKTKHQEGLSDESGTY